MGLILKKKKGIKKIKKTVKAKKMTKASYGDGETVYVAETTYTDKEGTVHPIMELKQSEKARYGFKFGLSKAKQLIGVNDEGISVLDEIKQFVKTHDPELYKANN